VSFFHYEQIVLDFGIDRTHVPLYSTTIWKVEDLAEYFQHIITSQTLQLILFCHLHSFARWPCIRIYRGNYSSLTFKFLPDALFFTYFDPGPYTGGDTPDNVRGRGDLGGPGKGPGGPEKGPQGPEEGKKKKKSRKKI
jgi:hypothetical protein